MHLKWPLLGSWIIFDEFDKNIILHAFKWDSMWFFYPEATVLKYFLFCYWRTCRASGLLPLTHDWLSLCGTIKLWLPAWHLIMRTHLSSLDRLWIQSCVRPGAPWETNHNVKASLPSLTDVHSTFGILSLPWIWRARKDWRSRNLNRGCAASSRLRCFAGVSFLPWENRSGTEQKLRSQ